MKHRVRILRRYFVAYVTHDINDVDETNFLGNGTFFGFFLLIMIEDRPFVNIPDTPFVGLFFSLVEK